MELSDTLTAATKLFIARQERDSDEHPKGEFDTRGRWYPSITEKQPCCFNIRAPSGAYPYSLLVHCRTITHIANLFNVPIKDLRSYVAKHKAPIIVLARMRGERI